MKKKLVTMLLVMTAVTSLCACGKKNEVVEEPVEVQVETIAEPEVETEVAVEEPEEEVEPELLKIENKNEYNMAMQIKHAYIGEEGTQYVIAADTVSNTNDNGFEYEEFDDRVVYANIAGKTFALKDEFKIKDIGTYDYNVADILKDAKQGFKLVDILYREFGILKFNEEGVYDSTAKLDTDTAMDFEAYKEVASEVSEFEEGATLTFMFDVDMANYNESFKNKYKEITGSEKDENISGELSVVVYTDVEGNCEAYDIIISAPIYWDSVENLEANPTNKLRFNDTNCYIVLDENDGQKVGFTNQKIVVK